MKVDSLEKFRAWVGFLCTAPEDRKPDFWTSDEDLEEINNMPRLFSVDPNLVLDNLEFIFEEVFGKIDEQNFWKYREYLRTNMLDSELIPYKLEVNPMHFLRVSKDDPSFIAFTPDDKYGVADRQLKMKPGRFLARYTKMTNEEIKERVTEYNSIYIPPPLMVFTETDDVINVYRNGPKSCMTKDWEHRNHPVRIYGTSPQLGILAIKPEGKTSFSARSAAVFKDGKWHPLRTYGDSQMMDRVYIQNSNIVDVRKDKASAMRGTFIYLEEDLNRSTPSTIVAMMPYIDISGVTLYRISRNWAIFGYNDDSSQAHAPVDELPYQPTSGEIIITRKPEGYEYTPGCSCHFCRFVRDSYNQLVTDIPDAAELKILPDFEHAAMPKPEIVQTAAP